MEQLHIYYSGEVQGVGMRITMKMIADQLGVNGFVRNLSDGRVELLIQGDKALLSKMKNKINNKFYHNFTSFDQSKETPTERFDGFEIR